MTEDQQKKNEESSASLTTQLSPLNVSGSAPSASLTTQLSPLNVSGSAPSASLTTQLSPLKVSDDTDSSTYVTLPEYKKDIYDLRKELDSAVSDVKRDFITVFGLFASLVTFLSIEVQVFQHMPRFSLVIGASTLLGGLMLIFSIVLSTLNRQDERLSLPLKYALTIAISLIFLSFSCFGYAVFTQNGFTINLSN